MALIGTLVGIIFLILICGVVYWAVQQLLPLIPLPPPFATIIHVLLVLILVIIVIWVIAAVLLPLVGVHVPFFRG